MAGLLYWFGLRSWHLRWGATASEVQQRLPGDDLVPTAWTEATHAITIQVTASKIWPWLVQTGQDWGGDYSYAWLENLMVAA